MKVVIFKNSSAFGGGEVYNITLLKILKELGVDASLFSSNKELLNEAVKYGARVKFFYWGGEPSSIRYALQFMVLLPINLVRFYVVLSKEKNTGGSVVIFQSVHDKIIGSFIAKIIGYKVVWIEHLSLRPWIDRLDKIVIRWAYIVFSAYVDFVMPISQSLKSELIGDIHIRSKNIEEVYYGIEVGKQDLTASGADSMSVFGFVGRLHPEKGVDLLIRAFKTILNKRELRLMIAGDGPDRARLEGLVRELGISERVEFLGFSKDIPSFMKRIDVLVLPSLVRESLGIVLLEAMLHGKICIASNIGGIPEIISDQRNGLLFDAGSIESLSRAMELVMRLSKTEAGEMSRLAYSTVVDKFSYEKMKESIDKIIK